MTNPEAQRSGLREQLARAIHESYREKQSGHISAAAPAMQPWESLGEDLKEANRRQADQIPEKLRAVGYGIRPATAGKPARLGLAPGEEAMLARMEHGRWRQERLAAGWRYGVPRDDQKKFHPCLVPWEELP